MAFCFASLIISLTIILDDLLLEISIELENLQS